jgi:O-antigen/teichoic acid export membrane protein
LHLIPGPMDNRTSRAIRGTLTSFLQSGLQIVLQILLAPLILRVAGQETLGAYTVLIQALGYLALLDFGFAAAALRFLSQAYGYDDEGWHFRQVMSAFRTFALVTHILYAASCVVLAIWIGPLLSLSSAVGEQARLGLYLMAGWVVLRTPLIVYGTGLIATQNLATANLLAILGNTTRLLLALGLVAGGFGLVGLMLANIGAELLTMLVQRWAFVNRFPNLKLSWSLPERRIFREMFGFGRLALLDNLTSNIIFQKDNLVVGYLYGAVRASVCYTTQMPSIFILQIITKLTDNAIPAINELHGRDMTEALRSSYLKLHRYTWIMAIPGGLGFFFLSKPFTKIWVGSVQYGGDLMVAGLALFIIIFTTGYANKAFIMATGRIKIFTFITVLGGIVNLTLSIILGRHFGLPGVIWATVIAQLPISAYSYWRVLRDLNVLTSEYFQKVIVPIFWPSLIATTILLILQTQNTANGWLTLFINTLSFISIYAILGYRFSINSAEQLWLKTSLRVL